MDDTWRHQQENERIMIRVKTLYLCKYHHGRKGERLILLNERRLSHVNLKRHNKDTIRLNLNDGNCHSRHTQENVTLIFHVQKWVSYQHFSQGNLIN